MGKKGGKMEIVRFIAEEETTGKQLIRPSISDNLSIYNEIRRPKKVDRMS